MNSCFTLIQYIVEMHTAKCTLHTPGPFFFLHTYILNFAFWIGWFWNYVTIVSRLHYVRTSPCTQHYGESAENVQQMKQHRCNIAGSHPMNTINMHFDAHCVLWSCTERTYCRVKALKLRKMKLRTKRKLMLIKMVYFGFGVGNHFVYSNQSIHPSVYTLQVLFF